MGRTFQHLMIIALTTATLTACTMSGNSEKDALCTELKHRIIFNGATSNDTLAQRQRVEMTRLQKSYHDEDCP